VDYSKVKLSKKREQKKVDELSGRVTARKGSEKEKIKSFWGGNDGL